jgi:hypothetical protein
LLSRLVLEAAGQADHHTNHELEVARNSTIEALERSRRGDGFAAHLCCGVLGLSSLLRVDAQATGNHLAPQVPTAESTVVAESSANGDYTFFSVDNGSLNLPGLFTGKAGVALALLEAGEGMRWLPAVLSAGLLGPC